MLFGMYSVNFFTWSIVKYQIYMMRVGGKSYIILMWSNTTTKFLSTTRERTNGTYKIDVPFLTFVQGQPGVALKFSNQQKSCSSSPKAGRHWEKPICEQKAAGCISSLVKTGLKSQLKSLNFWPAKERKKITHFLGHKTYSGIYSSF